MESKKDPRSNDVEVQSPMTEMRRMPSKVMSKDFSSSMKEVEEDVLFDSIGIQFHVSIFLYQLACHLFLPLMFSVPNPKGQGMRLDHTSLIYNVITPIAVYVMIACYFLSSDNDITLLSGSIWIPIMYFIAHKVVIALKYGTLSPTEYGRFCEATDIAKTDHYLSQMQLITGWAFLDPSVLKFELCSASARIGTKINDMFLKISPGHCTDRYNLSQLRFWNTFVRGHSTVDWEVPLAPEIIEGEDSSQIISVYDILLAVIRKAGISDPLLPFALLVGTCTTLIVIVISFIPVIMHYNEIDSRATTSLYLIASTVVTWNSGRVFYFILFCSIVDVRRSLRIYRILHCMIRLTDLTVISSVSVSGNKVTDDNKAVAKKSIAAILSISKKSYGEVYDSLRKRKNDPQPDSEKEIFKRPDVLGETFAENHSVAMTPRISFFYPQNIIAWTYCRVTMQHFGDRFRHRIDAYVGGICFTAIMLMISSLLTIILATDTLAVFESTLFIQSTVTVTILLVFLSILFVCGAYVNEELDLQRVTLAAHGMNLTKRIVQLQQEKDILNVVAVPKNGVSKENEEVRLEKELEYNEQLSECISHASEMLSVQNELKPLKILGMEAQMGMVISIATGALTFYSTLFSLYINAGTGVSEAAVV